MSDNMASKTTGNRPLGITILALLDFIGAVLTLITAIAAPTILTAYSSSILSGFGAVVMVVGIIVAVIGIVIGYGLWKGMKWAWWLEVIFSALSIISILTLNIIGFIVGIIVLYYMTRKNTKAYFGM